MASLIAQSSGFATGRRATQARPKSLAGRDGTAALNCSVPFSLHSGRVYAGMQLSSQPLRRFA